MRVLLYAKMLKETKAEETIVFFRDIFIIGSISIGGEAGPPAPPIEMLPMIKMSQKKTIVSSALVSFSI